MKKLFNLLIAFIILLASSCNSNSKKVKELVEKFELKNCPTILNEETKIDLSQLIDLKYHDYLIFNYLKYSNQDSTQKPDTAGYYFCPVFKLKSSEKFHQLVIYLSNSNREMYGETTLFTITDEGEILDKLNVFDNYGIGYLLTTSFNNESEFTTTEKSWDEDNENEGILLTTTKYKIDKTGKIIRLSSESKTQAAKKEAEGKDEYYITKEGIAGLKIGMKINEIEKSLPNLKIELFFSDDNMGDDYYLKEGEKTICIFHGIQGAVATISPLSGYETEKGISDKSTFGDLKKAYAFDKIEYDENDGNIFVYAKIKEMPNLNIILNIEIGEEIYDMDDNELLKKIPDSTKVANFFIEIPNK